MPFRGTMFRQQAVELTSRSRDVSKSSRLEDGRVLLEVLTFPFVEYEQQIALLEDLPKLAV